MTRVNKTRAQHAPQRSVAFDEQRAAHPKKKPYKIVLEAVTQEKKKLHSILTYASNAPTGFGFIPAGHPEVTEWCKEQCRQRNLDVHIVSVSDPLMCIQAPLNRRSGETQEQIACRSREAIASCPQSGSPLPPRDCAACLQQIRIYVR